MATPLYAHIPVETNEVGPESYHRAERAWGRSIVAAVAGSSLVAVGVGLSRSSTSLRHAASLGSPHAAFTELAVVDDQQCAKLWSQCGGEGYTGPTCCEEGSDCHHKPLKKLESYYQCVKASKSDAEDGSGADTGNCGKLWKQCGGEGFTGPTCCQKGSVCEDKALDDLPSFRQCRKKALKAKNCSAPVPGSVCAQKIEHDKQVVWTDPERFHGITGGMDDKEFQMFEHTWNHEASQCPEPCADGPCYFALNQRGCNDMDSWYCSEDDGSLKYACCCKYFNKEKNLTKPSNPDPDMANAMKAVGSDSPSLFCVAMSQPCGYELGLLQAQYAKGKLGLFGCNDWAIYSNESLVITPEGEHPVIKTLLINGSLSAKTGGDWGTALNTDVFIRFWDAVLKNEKAWKADWTVKVDPDTMWLPVRLRALLRTHVGPLGQKEQPGGQYLNNCHVGLHGPIEVLSRTALGNYKNGKKKCQKGKVSEIGQEDYFLRECFKLLDIQEVKAYNLMLEATLACQETPSAENPDRPPCFSAQVAFHPFKSTETWMRCNKQAENHPWALPVVPVTDGPSEANNRHG